MKLKKAAVPLALIILLLTPSFALAYPSLPPGIDNDTRTFVASGTTRCWRSFQDRICIRPSAAKWGSFVNVRWWNNHGNGGTARLYNSGQGGGNYVGWVKSWTNGKKIYPIFVRFTYETGSNGNVYAYTRETWH
jgi:hypothetical protein